MNNFSFGIFPITTNNFSKCPSPKKLNVSIVQQEESSANLSISYQDLLRTTADGHDLLHKLLLLEFDGLLHRNLTERVHRMLDAVCDHSCVVRLDSDLRWTETMLKLQEREQQVQQQYVQSTTIHDEQQCTSTTLHMNNLLHLCTSICCSTNLLLIYNLLHLTLLLCIDYIMYRYCT